MPNIYLNEKTLPEVADWKVGETYKIVLEVEMRDLRLQPIGFDEEEEVLNAEFRVLSAKPKGE